MTDLRHQSDAARIARLEAEVAALRLEVSQTRLALDGAAEHAVITLNLGGRIVGWNTGATNLLGYTSEDAMGRSGEMFFTPEDRDQGRFVTELCLAMDHGRAVNERLHVRQDGSRFWASGVMLPLYDGAGGTRGFLTVMCDGSSQQRELERLALVGNEAGHRMRNLLTVVQLLAARTARRAETLEAFGSAFEEQLQALAMSCDVESSLVGHEVWLHDVLDMALSAFRGPSEHIQIEDGPRILLSPNAAAMLALALHELVVNAMKHGALSTDVGRVDVCWQWCDDGRPSFLWREYGEPQLGWLQRRGLGLQLLEGGLARQFGGVVQLHLHPDGMECRIELPGLRVG